MAIQTAPGTVLALPTVSTTGTTANCGAAALESPGMRKKLVVAHRGDHGTVHENTLEAFQRAIECCADMIECDIRRTADGELVIHHDPDVAAHLLAGIPYHRALQLAEGYRIPRLTETLALAAGRIRLDLELKEAGYEAAVLKQIFDRLGVDGFVITSFLPEALARVRALSPGCRTGLLIESGSAVARELLQAVGANFLAPELPVLTEELLTESSQIPLLCWGVNEPHDLEACLRQPAVFGVVTDNPA
jgi:glycerophosphoryl diester phosphodiesterase